MCRRCWTPRDDQLPIGRADGGPQWLEELGIKRRRLWESLLRVIQSESQEDSNHSDQARQAQYLDTVHEVIRRILLRATFAGRCCCWWSNYLLRWLKIQRLRMSIIHELVVRKTKKRDKYAMLRFSGINALTPMSCKQSSKGLPVTSLPFCHCLSHLFNSAFTFMSWLCVCD